MNYKFIKTNNLDNQFDKSFCLACGYHQDLIDEYFSVEE